MAWLPRADPRGWLPRPGGGHDPKVPPPPWWAGQVADALERAGFFDRLDEAWGVARPLRADGW